MGVLLVVFIGVVFNQVPFVVVFIGGWGGL